MAFLEYFLMVIKKDKKESLLVERPEKFGGNKEYHNFESIKEEVISKALHPMDVKLAVAKEISKILSKIDRKTVEPLEKKAYS
jgi:tyrosyl-tRNA synthetase